MFYKEVQYTVYFDFTSFLKIWQNKNYWNITRKFKVYNSIDPYVQLIKITIWLSLISLKC